MTLRGWPEVDKHLFARRREERIEIEMEQFFNTKVKSQEKVYRLCGCCFSFSFFL